MWKVCVVALLVACGGEPADDKKAASSKSEADDAAARAVAGRRVTKGRGIDRKSLASLDEATTDADRAAANARLEVHQDKKSELEARRAKAQDEIDRLTGNSGPSAVIAKMQEFSSKMCACKTKACADNVNGPYTRWWSEMKKAKPEDARNVSAADTKRMADAATRYGECYTKLAMEAAGVGTDSLENRASAMIAKVRELSMSMCACTTKACADGVNDEYTQWGREMARTATPEDARNVTAADTKLMTEVATRYSECYTKLALAAAGRAP